MKALELMHAQVRVLYTLDGRERLHLSADRTLPETEWEAAPRFFLGRTPDGNVWHVRHDLSSVLQHDLDVLCKQEPFDLDAIRAVLGGGEEYCGPAYLVPQQEDDGKAVEITAENADLLLPHFPGTAERGKLAR